MNFINSLLRTIFVVVLPLLAQEDQQFGITGDWSGFRSKLVKAGLTLDMAYSGEIASNLRGGYRRGNVYLDNTDITLSLDLQRLIGWQHSRLFFYVLGNQGGSPANLIGDAQGTSNIDADDAWKIYEAWLEKSFFKSRLSFRFGLYDLNSEFDVREFSALFLNSSHGIGPDFSQAGENGPSIFPTTSVGLRIQIALSEHLLYQSAVLDGVPGKPDRTSGTHIHFSAEDGFLLSNEWVYANGGEEPFTASHLRIGLGYWYFTGTSELLNGAPGAHNKGMYFFGEKRLLPQTGIFLRMGVADDRINQFDYYLGMGAVRSGVMRSAGEDFLGISLAYAENGSHFLKIANQQSLSNSPAETVLEMTYTTGFLDAIEIQPDFQYVINPGTDYWLPNAWSVNLRFVVSL